MLSDDAFSDPALLRPNEGSSLVPGQATFGSSLQHGALDTSCDGSPDLGEYYYRNVWLLLSWASQQRIARISSNEPSSLPLVPGISRALE